MATPWDTTRVKAQLRLTAQRLGQIQYKMDSQGQITRRDIATLLQQGNIGLARAKAQKLIREDIYGDVLQTLEMQVGIILEHVSELERSNGSPSPVVVEAASSIIYAAPQTESRDLHVIRDILMRRLGPDFVRSAIDNRDGYVSPRIVGALSARPPSAAWLDQYLFGIAKVHGVNWKPDLQPHEKVNAISEMLDPTTVPEIDIARLRSLCSHGLPEYPPWLRPRVWRLLLGTLPAQKSSWPEEARKQRDNYYDLVRRLLEPIPSLPSPSTPLSSTDSALLEASQELSQVPPGLLSKLEDEPEGSNTCPLDTTSPEEIRIKCAGALDDRLRLIKQSENKEGSSEPDSMPEIRLEGTPEIRLEGIPDDPPESSIPEIRLDDTQDPKQDKSELHLDLGGLNTPEISLSAPDSPSSTHSSAPTTLLASRSYTAAGAHPRHVSALLRLLYIHSSLNPANRAPQIASLLVPLYSALVEEVEPQDSAHAEADAFWLFETVVGEFADLEDVESCNAWMRKLGDRLVWADTELAENMQSRGLDPALPHYSYRWLTPLLTHTLPLPAIYTVWDALFSRPMRERDSSPKLDYLVDVCTSMLLCARGALLRLGKHGTKSANLWGDENAVIPSSALGVRELDDAFAEGMALLKNYSLEDAGGIDAILQIAYDLATRREHEKQAIVQTENAGLGARLRNTVWRNLSTQATIAESQEEDTESEEEEEEEEDHDHDSRGRPTLTSRLANTVWKGITNQSAMEDPPTPPSLSPVPSPQPSPSPLPSPALPAETQSALAAAPSRSMNIWGYAEKLRDSDAAATIAKVSTNWRVKALDAWSKRGSVAVPNTPPSSATPLPPSSTLSPSDALRRGSLSVNSTHKFYDDQRRSSLPGMDRSDVYSPPARPAYFRPPRDSMIIEPKRSVVSPTTSETSPKSDTGSDGGRGRRKASLASIVGLDRIPSPQSATTPRFGPRPLLLNSSSLITAGHTRSPTQPANVAEKQWADAVRAKRPSPTHRHSQSSVSSLSPSDPLGRPRRAETQWSADAIPSRVVPLNRKTPSPMARNTRRNGSTSSTASSPPPTIHRRFPTVESEASYQTIEYKGKSGWAQADGLDSSTTLPSPPPPETPITSKISNGSVRIKDTEAQRGSVVLSEPSESTDVPSEVETPRKPHTLPRLQPAANDSDASVTQTSTPSRVARVRSKRYPPRLATLRTRDNSKSHNERAPGPNSLAAPEWPEDGDDNAVTPRAANFDSTVSTSPVSPRTIRRVRKTSGESGEKSTEEKRPHKLSGDGRARKISGDSHHTPRTRKVSTEGKESKHKRESAAVEGDDEGYDDLLSAYESEDSVALR